MNSFVQEMKKNPSTLLGSAVDASTENTVDFTKMSLGIVNIPDISL